MQNAELTGDTTINVSFRGSSLDDSSLFPCSAFEDEEFMHRADMITTSLENNYTNIQEAEKTKEPDQGIEKSILCPSNTESFMDDTASLLEEFGDEFDVDDDLEQELVKLDAF
jgi:hypothetical protein